VFNAAGLEVCEYQYYDAANHTLDFDGMLAALQQAQAGDVVLFHGCCHNPTGIDPTREQWQQLATLSQEKGWLPLFDFAYQGFARGLDEDAEGLRIFAAAHQELLVASSYSKNFGLYNERVGALTLVAASSDAAKTAFSQVKYSIRANYSNPPSHGAAVVATILSNEALRTIWVQELTDMRQRIQRMRQLFVNTLAEKGARQDFSFIIKQNGMFSFSGLTKDQVVRLRDEFGVYAVNSGRVNPPLFLWLLQERISQTLTSQRGYRPVPGYKRNVVAQRQQFGFDGVDQIAVAALREVGAPDAAAKDHVS